MINPQTSESLIRSCTLSASIRKTQCWHFPSLVDDGTLFSQSIRQRTASLIAWSVKKPPAKWEIWVWSLGWKDPLEKWMAIHFSNLAWKIPWTEEHGGPQSIVSQRVGRIIKRTRDQISRDKNQSSNCQHSLDHRENKGISGKYLILLHWLC